MLHIIVIDMMHTLLHVIVVMHIVLMHIAEYYDTCYDEYASAYCCCYAY